MFICRVGQKVKPQTHGHNLSNLSRFKTNFTRRFLGKFAVNWLLKIIPLVPYARKRAINDKLQGNVATYLRCGED